LLTQQGSQKGKIEKKKDCVNQSVSSLLFLLQLFLLI